MFRKNKNGFWLAAFVVLATAVTIAVFYRPTLTQALPFYESATSQSCGTCHVNPGGGGPLTATGKAFSAIPSHYQDPAGAWALLNPTPSPTATASPSPTSTATPLPSATSTPPTSTATPSPSATATATPTATPLIGDDDKDKNESCYKSKGKTAEKHDKKDDKADEAKHEKKIKANCDDDEREDDDEGEEDEEDEEDEEEEEED